MNGFSVPIHLKDLEIGGGKYVVDGDKAAAGAPKDAKQQREEIERIRAELALLLGLYQDHDNVPELMDLLRTPSYAGEAAPLIEGATGLDLANAPDRITAIEAWWREGQPAVR